MTEAAPDIPPWSPLADRARQGGDGTVLSPPDLPDGGATPTLDGATAAGPATSAHGESPPDQDSGPGGSARSARRWLVLGLLVGAVVALLGTAALGGDPAPSTTTVSTRAPLPPTSPDDPAPPRTRVALGNGWTASVLGARLDATRDLAPHNKDSDPLGKDERYVLVDLELTYLDGTRPADTAFYGVDLGVVGEDGAVVTTAEARCTVPKPALDLDRDVPRGTSVRGRVCFAVANDQAASLVLVAEPSMTTGSAPSYLALRSER